MSASTVEHARPYIGGEWVERPAGRLVDVVNPTTEEPNGRVDLARLEQPKETLKPKLPETQVNQVREEAARDDQEVTEGYERQAVITSAAHLLGEAGLWNFSDALLQASLPKSHSP